ASNLKFTTAGGTGDVDLYVKFGSAPTTASYDCRPYKAGNAETCTITTAKVGTYYVMLNGYAAYSGATLTGSFPAGPMPPPADKTGTCAHSVCATGTKLVSGCHAAATAVIAADSFCGTNSWDSYCVSEATSIGGVTCP